MKHEFIFTNTIYNISLIVRLLKPYLSSREINAHDFNANANNIYLQKFTIHNTNIHCGSALISY